MGGRGGSSGLIQISAFSVITKDGTKTQYFFSSKNGKNFYKRGIGEIPKPTPQNMNANEFKNRALSNGAKVENISRKELSRLEKKYKEERRKTGKFLDEQWYRAAPRPRKGMKGH